MEVAQRHARVVPLLLAAALLATGPSFAFDAHPPCERADETEDPPWIPFEDVCTGHTIGETDQYRFWTFVNDEVFVQMTSDLGAAHTFCIRPAGSPWTCQNVPGQGTAVDYLYISPNTGESGLGVLPYEKGQYFGGGYRVELSVERAVAHDDCSLDKDAEPAHSIADTIANLTTCSGRLVSNDPADFYRFPGGKDGSITVGLSTSTGTAQICLYPPTTATPTRCETYGTTGGSFGSTPNVNGSWRAAVKPVSGTPSYTLSVNSIMPNYAPDVVHLACALDGVANTSTACTVRGVDSNLHGLAYTIDWGDGSTTRVPSTGYAAQNLTQTTSHVWPAEGTYAVTATATDNGTPAKSSAPFAIAYTLVNHAPILTILACDAEGAANVTTSCSFRANDFEKQGVAYEIDWGDGSPATRVPASGHVASGVPRSASHVWNATGTYEVVVRAVDAGSPPLAAAPLGLTYVLQGKPRLDAFACAPVAPVPTETVTCGFTASDDSGGIAYRFSWGDGSGTTRIPSSGFLTPGTPASLSHAFAANGSYTIRLDVDDDGVPARTTTATRPTVVQANAPTMDHLFCGNSIPLGVSVGCGARASDDSPGVYYTFDWGDGTAFGRAPASGDAPPSTIQVGMHAWSAPGYYTASARATDTTVFPLTSAWRSVTVPVGTPQRVTGEFRVGGPGVSALAPPLVPAPPVDGQWIGLAVPAIGNTRADVSLTFGGSSAANLDVWFYDQALRRIGQGRCASTTPGAAELCAAPAGATWAHIRAAHAGLANVWFEFTYLHA